MGQITRRGVGFGLASGAVGAAVAQAPEAPALDGVFEACIGMPAAALETEVAHWRLFGFTPAARGTLSRAEALVLYGYGSAVTSVRLRHRSGEAGGLRLMAWDAPSGRGAGLAPMLAPGSRWLTLRTEALEAAWVHAEAAVAAGAAIDYVAPQWIPLGAAGPPWTGETPGVHVLRAFEPLRRVLFARYLDVAAAPGTVDRDSRFRASQAIAFGLVVAADRPDAAGFYRDTLGLSPSGDGAQRPYHTLGPGERAVMALAPGDAFAEQSFDATGRGGEGRLIVRATPPGRWPAVEAAPGAWGLTHFTYRTRALPAWHERLRASQARGVTSIVVNEFGESSLSFQAPDGSAWGLVQA